MISFPLPVLTALLCCLIAIFVWRLDLGVRRVSNVFAVLFLLCATEAFLVALRFGYGIETLTPLQRILPLLLGPMIYLGFYSAASALKPFLKDMTFHLLIPILVFAPLSLFPSHIHQLDWVISISYLVYTFLLFRLWQKGPDALSFVRVDITQNLSNWILRSIMFLVFVLVLDSVIALDFIFYQGVHVPQLISYGSVPLIMLLLAAIMLLPQLTEHKKRILQPAAETNSDDQQVKAQFDTIMIDEELYLDPYLSVQRIAKRLHIPARDVSGSINRITTMNVSQYVNKFRVTHAERLLINSKDSVINIAEKSGFLTRSNFYREFQRLHGMSPNESRKTNGS